MGGLLQSSKAVNRKKIIDETCVLELMSITNHDSTDPILLTAICRMALDLFETEELINNENIMEPFQKAIGNMRQLVPYLGFDKYPELMLLTKKYNPSSANQIRGDDEGSAP